MKKKVLLSLVALVLVVASGCSAAQGSRENESQSTQPISVRIKDPIPTYRDDHLQISVGEGRNVEVEIIPAAQIEGVEMHATAPDQVLARVAHAPFVMFLPKTAADPDGHRWVCITATDASGNSGEQCFFAVR